MESSDYGTLTTSTNNTKATKNSSTTPLEIDSSNFPHQPIASPTPPTRYQQVVQHLREILMYIMGCPATHAALTFLDTFVTAVIFPELPAAAATLSAKSKDVPLVVALVLGSLFLGRAGGALWWHHGHTVSHPSTRGDISSFRSVLYSALVYSLFYFIMGFVNRLWVLFLGQFILGLVMGGHAVRIRATAVPLLLGAMVGALVGGLYDSQHSLNPCPQGDADCRRWASGAPMAPVGIAVLGLSAVVILINILISHFEATHNLPDSSYRRLDAAAGQEGGGLSRRIVSSSGPGGVTTHKAVEEGHNSSNISGSSSTMTNKHGGPTDSNIIAAIQEVERAHSVGQLYHTPSHIHLLVIPPRYVRGCNNDMEEAARRWKETLAWRQEAGIDKILYEPQKNFRLIKECYPHFVHRRDKFGHPVYYELLGKINLKKLKAQGVSVEEMVRYYIFLTEYIWKNIEPDDVNGAMVSILDVEHVGIMDLRGDALEFLKAASKVVQQHYVERSFKMFILNAPSWFSVLWKIVAPLLHENTRKKINILGKGDHRAVAEVIDLDQLPKQYGGTDTLDLGEAPEEVAFREYVDKVNAGLIVKPEAVHSLARQASSTSLRPLDSKPPAATLPTAEETTVEGGEKEEEAPRGGTGQFQLANRLVDAGQRFFVTPIAGGLKTLLHPAFLTPEANLGRENRFVYDESQQQWVLVEEEEDEEDMDEEMGLDLEEGGRRRAPVDESEERLIRLIQAAHDTDNIRRNRSNVGGLNQGVGSGSGSGLATLVRERLERMLKGEKLASQASTTSAAAAGAGGGGAVSLPFSRDASSLSSAATATTVVANAPAIRAEHSRISQAIEGEETAGTSFGSTLLLSLVAWRAISLSILIMLPLWLADHEDASVFNISLLLFLGAVLATGLWALNANLPIFQLSSVICLTQFCLALALILLGPLTMGSKLSSHFKHTSAEALVIIISGFALLMYGGSVSWAIRLSGILFHKEVHRARYDLTPSLSIADVAGAVFGPLFYSFSTAYGAGFEESTSWKYPFGPSSWFSLCGIFACVTGALWVCCGRKYLDHHPSERTETAATGIILPR